MDDKDPLEGVYDQSKVESLINDVHEAAKKGGCTLLELCQACRAIQVACLVKMGGNATKVLYGKKEE